MTHLLSSGTGKRENKKKKYDLVHFVEPANPTSTWYFYQQRHEIVLVTKMLVVGSTCSVWIGMYSPGHSPLENVSYVVIKV